MSPFNCSVAQLRMTQFSCRGSNAVSETGCQKSQRKHRGRTWWDPRKPASTHLQEDECSQRFETKEHND